MHAAAVILLLSALPPASSPERSLEALERAAARLERPAARAVRAAPDAVERDLGWLRRPDLTKRRFSALAERYGSDPAGLLPTQRGEIAFRLARHAHLLGRPEEAARWIGRIPSDPAAAAWNERGAYLSGVLLLRAGEREAAEARFDAIRDARSDAGAAARLALARLRFDAGRYDEARALYSGIPNSSPLYEASLEEGAWTDLKLGRPDQAATDVELLFALFPDSPRLPEAGYLLGQTSGPETLEHLVTRFELEQEMTAAATAAYAAREEHLLSEFDPKLPSVSIRAVLPPLGRTLLRDHPVTRAAIAELEDLEGELEDLERLEEVLSVAGALAAASPPVTLDGVVLAEWANRIERQLAGEPEPPRPSASDEEKELRELRRQNADQLARLEEVDRNVWLSWRVPGGERKAEALSIQRATRDEIRRALAIRAELERAAVRLEGEELRRRAGGARAEVRRLRGLRPAGDPAGAHARLDGLRERTAAAEARRAAQLRGGIGPLRAELARAREAVLRSRGLLVAGARPALARALGESGTDLGRMLHRYRWTLAEARYRAVQQADLEVARVRREIDRETADLEQRFVPLETGPRPLPPPGVRAFADPELAERARDAERFLRAARERIEAIEKRIAGRIGRDRDRYARFHKTREGEALARRNTRREAAILAYRRYLERDPGGDRAPYALYRLAQLHFERAQDYRGEGLPLEKAEEVRRYSFSLAIDPLTRLRDGFPAFPHRDAALYLLGYVFLEDGNPARAVETFERLLAESPRSPLAPEVHLRVAEHYFAGRAFAKAVPHYQQVLSFGFNYFYDKALYKLAWSAYLMGRYDSAVAHFLILLDYAAELTADQRARFVEFADEAVEYVAFSFQRSGGPSEAERVFSKTGWKPYGLKILDRMARIASDRGDRKGAAGACELAVRNYPDAPEVPGFLRRRIEIFEELRDEPRARAEMDAARRTLGAKTRWRTANAADPEALADADRLLGRVTYALATRLDAAGDTVRASALYAEVSSGFAGMEEAYEADFRLGEIAFAEKRYADAVGAYDRVVRSDRYNARFNASLYGIVVSRERILERKAEPEAVDGLVRAIDNFAKRAPRDPRVPQALYRSAQVQAEAGRYDAAQETYLRLAAGYPESPWSQQALVASVDTLVVREKWGEASALSERLLGSAPRLLAETRSKLTALLERARFKEAEALAAAEPARAAERFLEFQARFPDSEFAPAAAFNAFAAGKRGDAVDPALAGLDLLMTRYPTSAQAAAAPFERAVLLDAVYDPKAADAYRAALERGLPKEEARAAATALAAILRSGPRSPAAERELLALAERLGEPSRSALELTASDWAADAGETAPAERIRTALSERVGAPMHLRAAAASRLAVAAWRSGNARAGERAQKLTEELARLSRGDGRIAARAELAAARAARIASDRGQIEGSRITTRTEKALVASFKRKATLLTDLEREALRVLKLGDPRAGASVLFDLGSAYVSFVGELRAIPPPAQGQEEFAKTIDLLAAPLTRKAREALEKSLEIVRTERLAEDYLPRLAAALRASGREMPDPPDPAAARIAVRRSPILPPFREPAAPAVGFRRPALPLAALDRPAADREIRSGLSALRSPWAPGDRRVASDHFARALFHAPGQPEALYNLALLDALEGRFDAAGRSIGLLRGARSEADLALLTGAVALLRGDFGSAAEAYLSLAPAEPAAAFNRIVALAASGRADLAVAEARAFVRRKPRASEAHEAFGIAQGAAGASGEARRALERATALTPDAPGPADELAARLGSDRELRARNLLWREAAERGHPEGIANWGLAAYRAGEREEACRAWRSAAQAGLRRHPDVLSNLALCETPAEAKP